MTDPRAPLTYRVASTVSLAFVWALFRPRVRGVEHVPSGGFVLAANHLSGWDTWALGYPLRRRWLRNMAKPQLFARPILGPLVRSLGAFAADPGAAETAASLARAGHVVVVMPEGARRRSDRVHRPRTGAARAALSAGVPLVPAALRGTDRTRRLARWHIAFGTPVTLEDLQGGDPRRAALVATERLWTAITVLEEGFATGPDSEPPA